MILNVFLVKTILFIRVLGGAQGPYTPRGTVSAVGLTANMEKSNRMRFDGQDNFRQCLSVN